MSIILKGINMPRNGECHHITIYDNGNTYITTSNVLYETDRKDAETIQIPNPHGDIIDRNQVFTYSHRDVQNLEEVPVIMEGEEE